MRHLVSKSLFRPLFAAILGFTLICSAATGALAQTKPKVTDVGDKPASAIYIGNSFFITTTACTTMWAS